MTYRVWWVYGTQRFLGIFVSVSEDNSQDVPNAGMDQFYNLTKNQMNQPNLMVLKENLPFTLKF